jgi:hypothetical protein
MKHGYIVKKLQWRYVAEFSRTFMNWIEFYENKHLWSFWKDVNMHMYGETLLRIMHSSWEFGE